jgi:hypothetical protein
LVLRTFSSTNGDVARTAKVLGVSTDEVRRDLIAMIDGSNENGDGGDNADGDDGAAGAPAGTYDPQPPKAGPPAKKPPTKKR